MSTILTICIPTYNRADYLVRCLDSIFNQNTNNRQHLFEVAVFDNCSTDITSEVVDNYANRDIPFNFFTSTQNWGPDINIGKCYLYSKSKYVWVLGDDDLILPGCLNHVLDILTQGEFGIVFLNSYGFKKDHIAERPKLIKPEKTYEYTGEQILKKMTSNVSFISGNIVNTKFINEVDVKSTTGTYLNQMPGILNAIVQSDRNIYINKYYLAQQGENSTSYKYFTVFGNNFPQIFNQYIAQKKHRRWVYNQLMITTFPIQLLNSRRSIKSDLEKNAYDILKPYYGNYILFWIFVYPIIYFPYPLAVVYTFFVRIFGKFYSMINLLSGEKGFEKVIANDKVSWHS